MASLYLTIAFLTLYIVLQYSSVCATNTSFPFLDKICDEVECGRGTCKASFNYTFNFICECQQGWKQTTYNNKSTDNNDDYDDKHRFLPCVIPNCTMNYSCAEAPPPTPEIQEPPKNISFFDPCNWAYCGEGSCSKTSRHGYKCDCKQGYSNLLNITAYPCFSQCVTGPDCRDLGISVSNDSSVSPNTTPTNDSSSTIATKGIWLMILMISLTMVPWK